MSIAPRAAKPLKVCRTLMCAAPRDLHAIKVLTDLENGPTRVAIDMQDLKDLKRRFFQKRFRRCKGEHLVNPESDN